MRTLKTSMSASTVTPLSLARPPRGAPTNGSDPYYRGINVLIDPSFENFVDNSGGWYYRDREVDTYAIPFLDVTCPLFKRRADGTCDATFTSWVQCSGPYTVNDLGDDQAWKVSVFDPGAGSYAAVWWNWAAGGGGVPAEICVLSPFVSSPFSARVNPGDTVTWTISSRIFVTTGTPTIQPFIRFFNSSWGAMSVVLGTATALTTTNTNYSVSTVAPPGCHYLRAAVQFLGGAGNIYSVHLDNAILGIT